MRMLEWLADPDYRAELAEIQRHYRCPLVDAAILLTLLHMTETLEAIEASTWMAVGVQETEEPETDDGQGE